MRVKATREGLAGHKTASGYVIDSVVPFVALPSVNALDKLVMLTNPANGKVAYAFVLDVGPFNEHDDAYVFHGDRPQAECGVSVSGAGTNKAGIDLGEKIWKQLGMTDNTPIDWKFVI
jgi:hypothetical protein